MSKTFRPYEPDQMFLMPALMRDWLPSGHLAYFISDVVDQLDLSMIMRRYREEERGYPPYHPVMMVKVLVYAYCIGIASSRKMESYKRWTARRTLSASLKSPDVRSSEMSSLWMRALISLKVSLLVGAALSCRSLAKRDIGRPSRESSPPRRKLIQCPLLDLAWCYAIRCHPGT